MTSIQNITNEYEKRINSDCSTRTYVDQRINGLDILEDNYGCDIIIENVAMPSLECQKETIVNTLTNAALQNDEAVKIGFGILDATPKANYKNKIRETINAQCSSDNNIKQNINNLKIHLKNNETNTCDVLKISNTADSRINCALGIYSKAIDEINSKRPIKEYFSQKKSTNCTNILITWIIYVMIVLLLILIIAIIFRQYSSK
ncbi:MAG: hypothetical protein Edafosvirus4_40 [Edafosvirus sp.]|uniref:Uncharacterized protein n=1 Tax=Edafosvirus sp. TaxID=2487765 RepID=A0A3G4ZT29_9VIRU|nr:MAG: hypothetical protein Edafosvirus4_40 [Edafosvirus sp.]